MYSNGSIGVWPVLLGGLAVLLLLSGIDDLIPSLICAWNDLIRKNQRRPAPPTEYEHRIAIFVPCWKESAVIGNMVRHNIASIWYRNYDFFLGVYPNDSATVDAAEELARTFSRVHVAACPHPGPTSKADCLNWIFQRMTDYEHDTGVHFDTVVLHDAEDLIHPEALSLIDRERAQYAMVQVPVLPLPTPASEVTHGVYCDDFAEFQIIDMRARQFCGAFVPSNGVGTGFAREILDRLAAERGNAVFNAASLTEDYEIGVYCHNAGYSQIFSPLKKQGDQFCATREFFPRRVKSAIRQRTRWVTGICLQSWARDGWRGSWMSKYWFWRDRKGLLTHPVSLLSNLLFLLGILDWFVARAEHRPWAFAISQPLVLRLCTATTVLQVLRLCLRIFYTSRIYGFAFGLCAPMRVMHGNIINCCASIGALWQYANARIHGRPLVWLKTDHAYPGRDAVIPTGRNLADVLVAGGYMAAQTLIEAQNELHSDGFLARFLLKQGLISEETLSAAMGVQSGVPFTRIDPERVNPWVARTLPRLVEKRFGVIPFKLSHGRLLVAGVNVPGAGMYGEVKRLTRLPVEFHLVTQRNYEELLALL